MNVEVIVPIITAIVSSTTTYLLTKEKNTLDKEQIYSQKLQELILQQSEEINKLKMEVDKLITENMELKLEIIDLKQQLEVARKEVCEECIYYKAFKQNGG